MAKLTHRDKKFVWFGTFDERMLPKEARFRWNPDAKVWWTDDPRKAASLLKYADKDAADRINNLMAAKKARLAESKATDCRIDIPVPDGYSYLGYQKAGIAYALKRSGVLLGDEMGLGKTVQALGTVNADPTMENILIICPASLKINWMREAEIWLTREMSIGITDSKKGMPDTDVVIINYDILTKFHDAIRSRKWDMLICDECHYLKNPKAKRTKEVVGYWDRKRKVAVPGIEARRRLLLTGTPLVNRPVELWPIVNALDPDKFRNFMYFAKRYCNAHRRQVTRDRIVWDFTGASNLEELQEIMRERFMVRRLKEEVLTELPAKRRQIIELPPTGAIRAIKAEQKAWAEISKDVERLTEARDKAETEEDYEAAAAALSEATSVAFTEMARVRHDTAVAKVPAVIEYVENALEAGGKIVLFAHHHDVINEIVEAFGDAAVSLTGKTAMDKRQEAVDRFQTDSEVKLFVGNIKAAGVGLTLTAASHVIFAELDWTPGNMTQAEDRCHRIGQKNSVLVQHLVFDETLDARMVKTLISKQAVADRALDKEIDTRVLDISWVEEMIGKKRRNKASKVVTLKPETVKAIHENLRSLASVCDGAVDKDGMGFNGCDTAFGHNLAYQDQLTNNQAVAARKMIAKYKKQLGEEAMAAMWE